MILRLRIAMLCGMLTLIFVLCQCPGLPVLFALGTLGALWDAHGYAVQDERYARIFSRSMGGNPR